MVKPSLGKGLSSLLGDIQLDDIGVKSGFCKIPIDEIHPNPNQPRKYFDEVALNQLRLSIEQKGVLQPIIVQKAEDNHYTIVSGERRWRASKMAGLQEMPVVIMNYDDSETLEVALIENLQREDLNVVEEAEGYRRLMDLYCYTQEDLAKAVSKSRSHVANILRILNLSDNIKQMVIENKITPGHAKALLSAKNPEELANKIIDNNWTVRQAEEAAREGKFKNFRGEEQDNPDLYKLSQQLSEITGLNAKIELSLNKGNVRFHFNDLREFDKLFQAISVGYKSL